MNLVRLATAYTFDTLCPSGAITDKYIDVELRERAKSALNKVIDVSDDNNFLKVNNRQEPI